MDTGVAGSVQDWQASKNSAGVWKFNIKAKLEHTAQASFKCGMQQSHAVQRSEFWLQDHYSDLDTALGKY